MMNAHEQGVVVETDLAQRRGSSCQASPALSSGAARGCLAVALLLAFGSAPVETQAKAGHTKPNILFVIMDDVGIDQMTAFGYGGVGEEENPDFPDTPVDREPILPTIQAIADRGIRFRNTWSMPACSTSRAVFFTGRYPLRTNVLGALGPDDLANAQVSPFEISLPKLLKHAGYRSALFGKFHLGLQGNNPFKNAMPRSLGWDYFYGWLDETGDPSSIDQTAGNVRGGPYVCGFVPGADQEGADQGACYAVDGSCTELVTSNGVPPGRACRDSGGILEPDRSCQHPTPPAITRGFQHLSAHYVSPLFINDEPIDHATDLRARTFRGTAPVDAAIEWIEDQEEGTPWMASLSFASVHTPVMQPPQALLTSDPAYTSNLLCSSSDPDDQNQVALDQRELTTLMLEALDAELGRLLVSIGVASRNGNGKLKYNPNNTDTMVVILGDNGTLATSVKLPFDPTRAKGTAYQTGVWVPLIVAGPLVKSPDREVRQMVNIADLYQLFGEMAGLDVHDLVPRKLDSMTMLPYLEKPKQTSVRSVNFAQVGPNVQADEGINGPCVIGGGCTQIPVTASVCTDNGGTWWGKDSGIEGVPETGLTYCCEVNQYLWQKATDESLPYYDPTPPVYYNLQPLSSAAIRNDDYKVVRNSYKGDREPGGFDSDVEPSCDSPDLPDEFYFIDEGTEKDPTPLIDYEKADLIDEDTGLPRDPELRPVYEELSAQLTEILDSQTPCPGDGNIDGIVDVQDEIDWAFFELLSGGGSSWYDINLDGQTDLADLQLVRFYRDTECQE